ncbi:MAG: efflux RND transporter periplasmic adaptor subunit [Planctomycetota bacterium]|nr:efflux RND transporter periplasmic adaptor subunit [Planctomycetota bacterium]
MLRIGTCLVLFLLASASPLHAEDRPASPVVLAPVIEKDVRRGRSFVGSIEPERRGPVDVQAAGYIEELLVEEGDAVEQGAVLARLRTTTLEIRIRAAQAELTMLEQALLELKNGTRREEMAQAVARVAEARAEIETAQWNLEAVRKLRKDELISEEELREALRAVAAARARSQALDALVALLRAGPRVEKIAQADARVAVQAAEVARLQDEKERHTVKAPYAGFVVRKVAEAGAWLIQGDPVVEVVALGHVDVVVPMLESDLLHLRRGMPVHVTIDALPEKHVQGTIHRIVPVADARSRTAPVKVRIKNTVTGNRARIKPGMFARVTLPVGETRKSKLVPKDAIVLGGRSPMVYVFDAESKTVKPVPVQLGVALDDGIEVEGELAVGAQVVIRGNERLRPGAAVRPVPAR